MTDHAQYKAGLYGRAMTKKVVVLEPEWGIEPLRLQAEPGYWFSQEQTTELYFDDYKQAYERLEHLVIEPTLTEAAKAVAAREKQKRAEIREFHRTDPE